MSLARLCDCPHHALNDECEHGLIDEFEQWATLAGKDICQDCLEGRYCKRWIPHVLPPPPDPNSLAGLVMRAYGQKVLDDLARFTP